MSQQSEAQAAVMQQLVDLLGHSRPVAPAPAEKPKVAPWAAPMVAVVAALGGGLGVGVSIPSSQDPAVLETNLENLGDQVKGLGNQVSIMDTKFDTKFEALQAQAAAGTQKRYTSDEAAHFVSTDYNPFKSGTIQEIARLSATQVEHARRLERLELIVSRSTTAGPPP